MIEKKVYCDCCKHIIVEDRGSFSLRIDRSMNGAGSMEDDYSNGDFCLICVRRAVQHFLRESDAPFENAKKILNLMKRTNP